MKSAESFIEALQRGLSVKEALSSLAPYELKYRARLPVNICRAAQELHLPFFPVPLCRGTADKSLLQNQATNDLQQLKFWARRRPNWALATGSASGVFALSVDGQAGQGSLLSHCGDDWSWLDTLRTAAGLKRFIFFRWPRGRRQREGGLWIGEGLCILGENDGILMPPAREDGVEYVYLNPKMSLIPPAAWLVNLIFEPEDNSDALQLPAANSFCTGGRLPSPETEPPILRSAGQSTARPCIGLRGGITDPDLFGHSQR